MMFGGQQAQLNHFRRIRARGFCDAIAEAGLPFTANDVLYGEWSEAWGREAARLVMHTTPAGGTIFCGSDQIARRVSDTLRLIGCRVPEDIALGGFDNWSPMVLGADPALTSVDMCLEDIGRGGRGTPAAGHQRRARARPAHCALPPRGAGLDRGRGAMSGPYRARPGAAGAHLPVPSLTCGYVSGHNPPGHRTGIRILVSSKWVHKVLSVAIESGHG
jgi:hypothetical protein